MSGDGGFDLKTWVLLSVLYIALYSDLYSDLIKTRFFPLFSKYIYTLLNTAKTTRQSTLDVLRNFQNDGVVYLELRTTPRAISAEITKSDYVALVLETINHFNSQSPTMVTKLILSIDRRNSTEEANEVIDLALQFRDQGVVGVDLCGNPAAHDISIFRPAFSRAKAAGLGVTLHFGEVKPAAKDGELEELLSWQPDRIGHVIYVPGSAPSQPQDISFRPANATDIPLIYRAERDYMRDIEPSSLPDWTNATDRNLERWIDNLATTTVLEVDEKVAGYVMWQQEHAEEEKEGNGTALIITIGVLPPFRRRGLGLQLLSVVTEQARKQGLQGVKLGVHRDNPAIALYSSAGFSKTGTDGDYINYTRAVETGERKDTARKDLKKVIADRKIGLELCLSCNVKLGMMEQGKGYVDHHFAEWRDSECPIILCVSRVRKV